ncbi:MAG TPA: cytochrome-c peroxidase, partial [Phaeodactylibacter sp.]|nr:cytochrome-c peroxidase [Phaeodactylibacter sp.]
MKKNLLLLLAAALFFTACQKDDDNSSAQLDDELGIAIEAAGGISSFQLPDSDDLDQIPQDPKNPLTPAKVALGKLLFHESALAIAPMKDLATGTYSCASCHFARAGFQAGRFQGIGEGGVGFGINGEGRNRNNMYQEEELDSQPIRSPSAMNVAYQKNVLWNGALGATGVNVGTEASWTAGTPLENNHLGYEGLETQAIAAITVHRMGVDMDVLEPLGYKERFDMVFSDFPEDQRYSTETAGLAIAAYERVLLANRAPFQKWLKGEHNAMTNDEKRGAILFFDKAKCVSCHNGPSLAAMDFYAIGLKDLIDCPEEVFRVSEDGKERKGRGGFTGNPADDYKYKVPQLYNLADSPFYGHGSNFTSIRAILEYKNNGVAENSEVPASQLAEEFKPLGLSSDELDDLTAFISNALHDDQLMR